MLMVSVVMVAVAMVPMVVVMEVQQSASIGIRSGLLFGACYAVACFPENDPQNVCTITELLRTAAVAGSKRHHRGPPTRRGHWRALAGA